MKTKPHRLNATVHFSRNIGKTLSILQRMGNMPHFTVAAWTRPRTTLALVWLRQQFRRLLYGPGDEGDQLAAASEPAWLSAVWKACGIYDMRGYRFSTPDMHAFAKRRIYQDEQGVWWTDTEISDMSVAYHNVDALWMSKISAVFARPLPLPIILPPDWLNKISVTTIDAPEARFKFDKKINIPIRPIVTPSAEDLEELGARVLKYRRLKKGEIVLATDEIYDDHKREWVAPGLSVGKPAPDPCYTSHRQFRRKIETLED